MRPMVIAGAIGAIIGAVAVLLEQLARPKPTSRVVMRAPMNLRIDSKKIVDVIRFNGTGR